uniref:Zmp:0000001267 n=1 Tax=Sphaeramia orbicularis TaxID=375764 RepID=A0A673C344_9TELE
MTLSSTRTMESGKQGLTLKREVGLIGAVSFIAGTMMGSGIFISPQYVLSVIGSPGASLIIWTCCGLLAMLGGLCYAELGTIIPESGGEYIYMLRTTGKVTAFMFVFSFIIVMKPVSATGIALSFGEYVVAPFYEGCSVPQGLVKCVAAGAILTLSVINCLSVRLATHIQVLSMGVKILALVVIILGGCILLFQGNTENFNNAFEGTNVGVSTIGIAFYQGLWSYDGWNTLNYITEELKHPEVNLPRAVVIAISLVTGLYLLVNVNRHYFISMSHSTCYIETDPEILAMAHVHRLTPSPALIFTTIISLVVLIPGDFQSIVNYFSFTAWFFYAITLSGLLYLKIKKPELPRPYTVPIILPILVLIAAIFLVLAPIIDSPQIEYLYVALFIFSGVIVYVPFIHYKLCPGLLTKLTVFLQLLLKVALAEKNL